MGEQIKDKYQSCNFNNDQ